MHLRTAPPEVVLVENIRLRPNNPVWSTPGLLIVVSLVPWRGDPPRDKWSWTEHTLAHSELGGVSNGTFKVFLARNKLTEWDVLFSRRPAAPAKLHHVLDQTVTGPRCALPTSRDLPLGQSPDGLLLWERRLSKISAPTVFSKKYWVKRLLSTKEFVSVLDLPVDRAQ
jgi:hypothetical protein